MNWFTKPKRGPILSPYYQGYVDADKSNGYFLRTGEVRNLPLPRWPSNSAAHELWLQGVTDCLMDKATRGRSHRGRPPHPIV